MESNRTDSRVFEILETPPDKAQREDDHLIVLSSGVVLHTKRVPPLLLQRVEERFPEPRVPVVYDKDKDRNLPNPDDPDYRLALKTNDMNKGNAMMDILMATGTEIVSVPDDLERPEDDGWIELVEDIGGVPVPRDKRLGRYLCWLKYYAVKDAADVEVIARKSSRSLGVSESEVSAAINSFRGDEEQPADS